ncbi:hypothetical protein V8D89_000713 [Ganoderma adspersum]
MLAASAWQCRAQHTIAGITTSAVNNLNRTINSLEDCISGQGGVCSDSEFESSPNVIAVDLAISRLTTHDIVLEYCVGTAALTTNIVIGDAIVLGRVYVLWHRNRWVCLLLIILLLGTVATSFVSTTHACPGFGDGSGVWLNPSVETTGIGSLVGPAAGTLGGSFFEGDHFGLAASVLSLATNAISTYFIGYRAWEHRALVRGNGLRSFLGRSQVSRALTLLMESGAVYSAIWIFVVVYQFITSSSYNSGRVAAATHPHSSAYRAFTVGWEAFTEGGLVIVVAIYPTVIMLLAGLNRSECDNIASYHGNGRSEDAAALSVVFRGSGLVPAQPLNPPGASRLAPQRASEEAASEEEEEEESLADLDMVDCSSERGYPSSVVRP